KNLSFNLLSSVEVLSRVFNFSCPRHFRNVDKTFDTIVKFNEYTVIFNRNDFTLNKCTSSIFFLSFFPRIWLNLLKTKRNSFFIRVKLKDLNFNFVTDVKKVRWMLNSSP